MSRIAYVNGRYLPHRAAQVHIEDRGYQFSDGVYEVIALVGGRFVDLAPHLDRLERSLGELRIAMPMSRTALTQVMAETVRRNGVGDGILYMQLTRGVAPRDHRFPTAARTQVVMTARRTRPQPAAWAEDGVKVITRADNRWGRVDIKAVSLLPNVLAKQAAAEAGAAEAWFVDREGRVTDGGASNAWIVTQSGELVTRPADHSILNGIVRQSLIRLARAAGKTVIERAFTVAEAKAAREAFGTGTTTLVLPVTRIDDQTIANGKAGSVSRELRALYLAYMAGDGSAAA